MRAAFVFVLLFFSLAAQAKDPVKLDLSKPDFANQQKAIVEAVKIDPAYFEITDRDRNEVIGTLDRLAQTFTEAKTLASLDAAARDQALAEQNQVNRILDKAAKDSRQICRQEKVVGSNMPKRVCMTAAKLRRMHENVDEQKASIGR